MFELPFFPRPDDARKIADGLEKPFGGGLSGLFLAAPRRTGKTAFLRRDLKPALEKRGYLVLYTDFWEILYTNPADVIADCITKKMHEYDVQIANFRKKNPLSGIMSGGISVDLKSSGQWTGSISEALDVLSKATEKNIVFIIDDAQHSLESKAGMDAMCGLKFARDAANRHSSKFKLYMIMTGYNQDKLASLMNTHKGPFYGARIKKFPTIGAGFASFVLQHVKNNLIPDSYISVETVQEAFETLQYKPEMLRDCLYSLSCVSGAKNDNALKAIVEEKRRIMDQQIISIIQQLPPLQYAILKQKSIEGSGFKPFSEKTGMVLMQPGENEPPSVRSIQQALDDLCKQNHLWKTFYGRYILEDTRIKDVLGKDDADCSVAGNSGNDPESPDL